MDDILSDDSNDSFFEDPKVLSKKSSLTKTPEKKLLSDLFNLVDDNVVPPKKETTDKVLSENPQPKTPAKLSSKPVKKISFEDDDDDILSSLGLKSKPTNLEIQSSKKEDILEPKLKTEKKPVSFEDILKESKVDVKENEFKNDLLPKQSTIDLKKESNVFSLSANEEPARRRRRSLTSGSLVDPLGLFSSTEKEEKIPEKPKQEISTETLFMRKEKESATTSELPDWLGGSSTKFSKSDSSFPKSQKSSDYLSKTDSTINPEVPLDNLNRISSENLSVEQKMLHTDMEFQNSFLAMQQQESQLLVALQLKKYEQNLLDIQRQQQEVLNKQEKQFQLLLDKYFSKQQIMENNIKLHQERINNHIQMLISQQVGGFKEHKKQEIEEKEEEEIRRVQEYSNAAHQEEMNFLQESYKKQIVLLEQQIEAVETRLKIEIDSLTQNFQEKMEKQKENYEQEIDGYKKKLTNNEVEHLEQIKLIKENCHRLIEEIRLDHNIQIEHFKKLKEEESQIFSNGRNYVDHLTQSIGMLENNTKILTNISEKVGDNQSTVNLIRESALRSKEKEIEIMKEALEKSRERAELERTHLLGLVKSLEEKIADLNQNSREEQWAFQQAVASFNAKSAALDRENEFNRTSIEREREQLKTLKESLQREQEKVMLELQEEKIAIAAEKSRLEISAKLSTNSFDQQRIKAEAEAAIQTAKEITEATEKERQKLLQQLNDTDKLKRQLAQKEKDLISKQRDLDEMVMNAERRNREGEMAIEETKRREQRFNERMQELKNQMQILSTREKKLAAEKIAISRERLELFNAIKQYKKCSLCAANKDEFQSNYIENFENVEIIDPDLQRFRLEIEDDLIASKDG